MKGVTMPRHTAHKKWSAGPAVLVALTAAILLGVCAPASALRPRTTPAHMAALAAADGAAARSATAAVARHDAMISRMVARHDAAGQGSAAVSFAARDRLHQPTALSARGALAVATFAALAAIVLTSAAVVMGSRTEGARPARGAAWRARRPSRQDGPSPADALEREGQGCAGAVSPAPAW